MRLNLLLIVLTILFLSSVSASFASDAVWVHVAEKTTVNTGDLREEACHCGSGECYGVDTDPGRPRKPCRTLPGDRNRGDFPPLRYRMCDSKRTGNSQAVAPWAICGRPNTHFGRYTAWFVGGGAAFADVPGLSDLGCEKDLIPRGRDREAIGCGQHGEGTWGLDYQGFAGHAKVWLKYTTGFQGKGRTQGGEGAYRTDGEPKIVAKLKEALHH